MIEAIKQYKNIIFFVGLVLFAFVLFSLFLDVGGGTAPTLVSEGAQEANVAERELLATLLELRSITLDEEIFDDTTFRQLEDFSQELVPEPVGRPNPFAPLPFSF